MWTFDRKSLDHAVNIVPGVVSTFDANGRRNESDIFVRGFGRWQVPLMVDGVRIYLPADNRLDFSRFLTADIAEVQIQKGYASVLDGPGAMGGAINLVTRKPAKPFEAEGSVWTGGRATPKAGTATRCSARVSRSTTSRAAPTIRIATSGPSRATTSRRPTSLQPSGRRLSSDSSDSRFNLKAGFTPNDTDEYTVNFIKQLGEKGAPLNVYNNPPVPPNSYWRWPYWDVQNTSFLSKTQLGAGVVPQDEGLLQHLRERPRRVRRCHLHDAVGERAFPQSVRRSRLRRERRGRRDARRRQHAEGRRPLPDRCAYRAADFNRPTHPTLSTDEPVQEQSQNTWSVAARGHVPRDADGRSRRRHELRPVRDHQGRGVQRRPGLFEYPKGGSDAFNWQRRVIWRYSRRRRVHASVSDRARFPVIFELYSTRFGTATPNPDLGPERATNLEVGWKGRATANLRLEGTRVLQRRPGPHSDGRPARHDDADAERRRRAILRRRDVGRRDDCCPIGCRRQLHGHQPDDPRRAAAEPAPDRCADAQGLSLRRVAPIRRLTITPSLDVAGDRWSDVNPAPAFPYMRPAATRSSTWRRSTRSPAISTSCSGSRT